MLTVLNKFSRKELKKFRNFISSPYFNKRKSLLRVFDCLISFYPYIRIDKEVKTFISVELYSRKRVNDTKIRKLLSRLSLLLEKFILMESVSGNSLSNELTKIKIIEAAEFDKRLSAKFSALNDKFSSHTVKNKNYYRDRISFDREYYVMKVKYYFIVDKKLIRSCHENIEYLNLYLKLESYYDSLSLKCSLKDHPDLSAGIDMALSAIAARKAFFRKHHPVIYFKYLGIMLFTSREECFESELVKYYKKDILKYDESFSFYYYSFLENFYNSKTNERDGFYIRKLLGIYDDIYNKGLYVTDNVRSSPKMLSRNFSRIVGMAYSLKENKWADNFIMKTGSSLFPVLSGEMRNLAMARMYYERKDYNEALKYLHKVGNKDTHCYVSSYFLLARIHFELKNFREIECIVRNLQTNLYRNKNFSRYETEHIKKFVIYFPKLLKVFTAADDVKQFKASRLIKKLTADKGNISFKSWYLDKLSSFHNEQ